MAIIKRPDEIALMAESGRLLAQVFAALDRLPLQGRSTMEINDFVERMIVDELQARWPARASTASRTCSTPRSTT